MLVFVKYIKWNNIYTVNICYAYIYGQIYMQKSIEIKDYQDLTI